MIEARHIEEALQRFEDFAEIQHGADPSLSKEELIDLTAKYMTDPGYAADTAGTIRSLRHSVMDDGACKAFIEGVNRLLVGPTTLVSREELASYASFVGLIVGLTAAQLQAESG
jgi:hypothetical protein